MWGVTMKTIFTTPAAKSAIRDVLLAIALALGAALTVAWDGLLGYGLFQLARGAL
jgi:hypothetical protein